MASIILLSLLWLPFWASAQWSVNLIAGGGIAKEFEREEIKSERSYSFFSTPGYSYFAGIGVYYFFSQHIGLGSGLAYSNIRSRDNPFFLGFHLGYEYNLSEKFRLGILLNDDVTYTVAILEFVFQNSSIAKPCRTHGRIIPLSFLHFTIEAVYFLNQIEIANNLGEVAVYHKRYYFTAQVTLSYRLFGHNGNTIRK